MMTEPSDRILDHLDSDDELFDDLERDDDDLAGFREQRIEQLKAELERARAMRENAHGTYAEIKDEKEVLKITTSTNKCVVHFFHKEFRRCAIMDKHLEALASKHFRTRFIKVNVENAPFLVDRLKVKVLPCVVLFVDGISKDRVIGFEELGNTDAFRTPVLEARLLKSGVITPMDGDQMPVRPARKSIFGFADTKDEDASSDED
ncbi:hypothetical protein AMAG_04507 [Allomyces macrogynus ATCC 38327]|uniref:Thioredoxin domain-containing protein n=1 Tax=Allomyces macrogynus (strain ATCC 38327) TaxID=578462 RepID=A0A0L0S543_ALLM3|nr:hypothetical protein AMAG_04507 [Allomyces macrogynus ATCC 38327]|eukprot:KNE57642.1 hypothetical protein AMAG_04507 [Allomyces macrogynus ATCC 38327]